MALTKITGEGVGAVDSLSVDGGTIKLDGNYPTGTQNVALGDQALDALTTGANNTGIGHIALSANTEGVRNVALGGFSLNTNTTGNDNVGIGTGSAKGALHSNTTGSNNVAVGANSLGNNTTASNNTAVGFSALVANTTGALNTAAGSTALDACTEASNGSAFGYAALGGVTTGSDNSAFGVDAGKRITTGTVNSCFGKGAGEFITTGSKNTVLGSYNGNQDSLDIRTSNNNIVLSDGDGNARAYFRSSGDWQFHGNTSNAFGAIIENKASTGPNGLLVRFLNNSDDNGNKNFFECRDGAATRMRILNDGDVQNHDNSYGSISDQKVKEQIADASSQWDDIKALTVRKYKMKEDVANKGDSDALWRLGLVAQEVETAGMSGLVIETPDVDADGNDLGTTTKALKYSILYMKAVKALQESMARIETLETKVAALEAE